MHFLSCAGEFNHHGRYMCDSLYKIMGNDFIRITTKRVNAERLNLGYSQNEDMPYNKQYIESSNQEVKDIVLWSDIVDYGAAPEIYLEEAIKNNKIVFIRIERLFKEGFWKILAPKVFLRYYRKYIRYRNNPKVYFLCISAYAAKDLARIGIKNDRVLQWAYCPQFVEMKEDDFKFHNDKLELLWCGRMIGWKRPEMAVKIAKQLKEIGCAFVLKMLGNGEKLDYIRQLVRELNLEDCVEIVGAVKSEEVRNYMKKADVFLATSDQNEGWGVVINEAMNSGCAVFATQEMGAVPVLIQDGKNGFYLQKGQEVFAAKKIMELSRNSERIASIKKAAYITIRDYYSPDIYAQRFVEIANNAIVGKKVEFEHLGAKAAIR